MKKALLLPLFIFLTMAGLKGQYCTNPNMVWAFGSHGGLNFSSGTPTAFYSPISILEGSAAVSDSSGHVLFYTDGKTVWDRTATVMPNGASIVTYATSDAAQGAQIVPIVGTTQYYIFSGNVYTTGFLSYTLVDMSLNGGYGDVVTSTMGVSMGSHFAEKLTATAGNNCDAWLITHRRDSAVFWVYNITASGISSPVVSSVGTITHYNAGVMKVSPNRQKIVGQVCEGYTGTELFDFDPSTGIVSNCQELDAVGNNYGAEFSPDNTKLYGSTLGGSTIYQYDVTLSTTAAIIASKTAIGSTSSAGDFKLAPDNKIYIVKDGPATLDCISSPNLPGTSCGFVSNAVTLASGTHGEYGLPNIVITIAPHDTFHTVHDTSVCIPFGGGITITAHDSSVGIGTCRVPSFLWNDGFTTTPTHNVTLPGIYWVYIRNGCGIAVDTIHVLSLYPDTITGITVICSSAATALSATITGGIWSSTATSIATVDSSAGIATGVSPGTATIFYASPSSCTVGITVTVHPTPIAITGLLSICAGTTTSLYDGTSGGAWSSSNSTVATVNTVTGFVTSGAPGNTTITYDLSDGCSPAIAILTVNPLPPAITGTTHVCSGASTTLGDGASGGTWSSTNTSAATIGASTGIAGSITTGMTIISYTLASGCAVNTTLTVNPLPSYITGLGSLCVGAITTISDGISFGTWSSGNTAVATVGSISGIVTGAGPGIAALTYTLPTGCASAITIAVYPVPAAITGPVTVCTGLTITMHDTTAGGTWSCSSAIATIDFSSGVVTGTYGGTTTISYTTGPGCAATATITVNASPSAIVSASSSMCAGDIAFLGDATAGGTWSSDSTSIATVDPITGVITAVSGGTAVISYSISTGCAATDTVTVNTSPGAITGGTGVCVELTTTLTDPTTGGLWSSDNTLVATVGSATGVITGLSIGTAGITYTMPLGCFATSAVTVNSSPGSITGTMHVCTGSTTALSDPAGGGTWSSSSTSVATIGSLSGIANGLIPGPVTITYSLGAGCSVTAVVTVNPLPTAITGASVMCAGITTILVDGGGGSWSSSNTSIATTGPAPGAVTGAAPGPTVITYTLPTGCAITKTVTVNPLPAAIGGTLSVCSGATTTLTDPASGGTWSPASSSIATVGSAGVVTGISSGTAAITYTLVTGCARTATVTVNPLPMAIGGSVPFCQGATVTLNDITGSGTWSTTSTIATVGSATGIVTGESSGTAVITYTIGTGCKRTTTVTVNPLPTAISGPSAVCVGTTIPETDAGGNWSGGSPSVATIGSGGVVTGVALGSTGITYTLPTGCAVTKVVSVSLSPVGISGAAAVCAGDTTILSDAVSGGAWSSSNTSAATVGSLTGVVTGAAPGIAVITYSLGTGCTVTKVISVNAAPSGITGAGGVCIGSTITLGDITAGGTWSPAVGSIATVNASGMVSGLSAGVQAISYTVGGCASTANVTVNTAPTALGGPSAVCAGDSVTLIESVGGGTWTSSHTSVATVAMGTVTGVGAGVTIISYSLGAGCTTTKIITVNPISAITGATGVCVGATTALADLATGGTWSSPTGAGIATINATTGLVTGLGTGAAGITYTTAAGCTATTTVTVNLAPSAIGGNLHVCVGATTALSDAAPGGTWTSSNTAAATVLFSTGVVTGIAPGTSIITYSLGSGCTVNATVTINPLPPAITGTATVCAGSTTNLADVTTGGTWGPSSGSIATVNATGVVTGVSAGIATITYSPGSGCSATKTITVNPTPAPITGITNVCVGLTTTLTDTTTGGTWSPSVGSVATVSASGVVLAVSPGSATITYALPTGCAATTNVIVNSAPGAIFGTMKMCVGSATTLSDPTSGGTWSPATGSIATVNGAGMVSGVSIGTATISYTVGGCPATTTVTVNSLPGIPTAASGMNVCVGSAIILTDSPTGGTWSSPTGAGIVMVDAATGAVTGEAEGTAEITYSLGVGCTASTIVTVNPLPAAPIVAGGADNICKGYTTIVTDIAGSGTWSCTPAAVATITASGIVTGAGGGTAIISFTISTGCAATTSVSVTAVPTITGVNHLCAFGDTAHVYDAMPGGTWSSTLATVSPDGLVTGYAAGTATVTYTLGSGCYATTMLTVNPCTRADNRYYKYLHQAQQQYLAIPPQAGHGVLQGQQLFHL